MSSSPSQRAKLASTAAYVAYGGSTKSRVYLLAPAAPAVRTRCPQVGTQRPQRRRVVLDEGAGGGSTRKRFNTKTAGAGKQVEDDVTGQLTARAGGADKLAIGVGGAGKLTVNAGIRLRALVHVAAAGRQRSDERRQDIKDRFSHPIGGRPR